MIPRSNSRCRRGPRIANARVDENPAVARVLEQGAVDRHPHVMALLGDDPQRGTSAFPPGYPAVERSIRHVGPATPEWVEFHPTPRVRLEYTASPDETCHPLRPVVAMPRIMNFWETAYASSIGPVEITAAAMSGP